MRTLATGLMCAVLAASALPMGASAATDEEIQASIDAGIAWLIPQQNADGSWEGYERVAHTGFALVKLEDRAYETGYDSPFDPDYEYSGAVAAGISYVFSQAITAGTGVHFDNGGNSHQTYNTGIALMAIAAAGTPGRVVAVAGSAVDGWTHAEVMQGVVDWFAAYQNTDGGFKYNPQNPQQWDRSDNSNTGYAVLGLAYAEDAGAIIPQSLKDNLSGYVDMVQCTDAAHPDFGGSGYTNSCGDWVNQLKTGNLLLELSFLDEAPGDPRVDNAVGYVERLWDDPSVDPGWKGGGWWSGPHFQAMYALMKGFESHGIESITVDSIEVDWFAVMADSILVTQQGDGSWPWDYWGNQTLATVWALLTLERVAPPPPTIPVAVDIHPTSCPNPFTVPKQGVVPVAILGAEDFDVAQIDPASVALMGVPAIRWSYEDVATPYGGELTDCMSCTEAGADGYMDLTLKFSAPEVAAAVAELEPAPCDGDCIVMVLTGSLTEEAGGTAIEGADIVRIQIKGNKKPAGLAVAALGSAPNPANPVTTISYALEQGQTVRLVVYNALGQVVRVLVEGQQPAGHHSVTWDGRDGTGQPVTTGLYIYRLEADGEAATGKLLLLR